MAETTIQPPPQKDVGLLTQSATTRNKRTFRTYLAQSARMWLRNALDRENVISSLKSLAWVAPMTVLIWIYAERELSLNQPVQFHLDVRNNNPDRVVELRAAGPDGQMTQNFTVRADLAGPNARLEHEKEKLDGGGGLEVQIPEMPPGHHLVPLSSLLVDDPTFKEEGLTPTNILPSQVDVFIDPMKTRQVPVKVPASVVNLDGPASFKPPEIEVTGPASVLNAAAEDGRLVAYANLPNLNEPGAKSVNNVPVTLPINDPHVHVAQSAVAADYTVKSLEVTKQLNGVPVLASYPSSDAWDKIKAVFDSTLSTVPVTGLETTIDQVNRPDYQNKPKVFLDLSKLDPPTDSPVPGKSYTAPLVYDFGDTGLKLGPDAKKRLDVTIVERKD